MTTLYVFFSFLFHTYIFFDDVTKLDLQACVLFGLFVLLIWSIMVRVVEWWVGLVDSLKLTQAILSQARSVSMCVD